MIGARIGLLTGPVGVGKTTVAERVIDLAQRRGLTCDGLLAPAIVDGAGQKIGIWGVNVRSGERQTLARSDLELGGPAVGPYSFDTAALDWALAAIERAVGKCDLLVVDEIGKLELWHGSGLAPLLPRLASGEARRSLVLVRDYLLSQLQTRLEAVEQVLLQVSQQNREAMPPQVLRCLL